MLYATSVPGPFCAPARPPNTGLYDRTGTGALCNDSRGASTSHFPPLYEGECEMSTTTAPIAREALLRTLGPTGAGYSLPQEAYTSQDVFEWELSLIHISEPTRRTPISYAVFCLKKKNKKKKIKK